MATKRTLQARSGCGQPPVVQHMLFQQEREPVPWTIAKPSTTSCPAAASHKCGHFFRQDGAVGASHCQRHRARPPFPLLGFVSRTVFLRDSTPSLIVRSIRKQLRRDIAAPLGRSSCTLVVALLAADCSTGSTSSGSGSSSIFFQASAPGDARCLTTTVPHHAAGVGATNALISRSGLPAVTANGCGANSADAPA